MQEIICILDGSGSMSTVADEAMNGFNQFLKDQQAIGEANLTLVWFDTGYDVAYEGRLSEAQPLTSWRTGSWTALNDAIGKTFAQVKERFTREKPEKVILAIQTDGMENASKEFTLQMVKNLIQEHENKYGWTVIYLGAGLKSASQAQSLGIGLQNIHVYEPVKTKAAFTNIYSASVTKARQ